MAAPSGASGAPRTVAHLLQIDQQHRCGNRIMNSSSTLLNAMRLTPGSELEGAGLANPLYRLALNLRHCRGYERANVDPLSFRFLQVQLAQRRHAGPA